jgi:hypothetical protein
LIALAASILVADVALRRIDFNLVLDRFQRQRRNSLFTRRAAA